MGMAPSQRTARPNDTLSGHTYWLHALLQTADYRPAHAIRCRSCKAAVTGRDHAFRLGASDQHSFINPHGLQYRVRCYRNAPGCDLHGRPTADHSWFHGYRWQLAFCCDCTEHLGWHYQRGEQDAFYALIITKLVSCD